MILITILFNERNMNKKLLFVLLCVSFKSCGYWINPRYSKMSKKIQEEYKIEPLESIKEFSRDRNAYEIYSTDVQTTKDLIQYSEKPYTLVVFYAHWCAPCHKNMPEVVRFEDQNKDSLNLICISSSDWLEKEKEITYLKKYQVGQKTSLIIDYKGYGDEFMNWNRIANFLSELVPKKYSRENEFTIALPHYLLFNSNMKLLKENGAPFLATDFEKYLN